MLLVYISEFERDCGVMLYRRLVSIRLLALQQKLLLVHAPVLRQPFLVSLLSSLLAVYVFGASSAQIC